MTGEITIVGPLILAYSLLMLAIRARGRIVARAEVAADVAVCLCLYLCLSLSSVSSA